MEATTTLPGAYAHPTPDPVREHFEVPWLAALAAATLAGQPGRRVLELGCGSGLGAALAARTPIDYTGVDFRPPGFALPGPHVEHDLRDGLGPVGGAPFDLYLAGFGLGSHLTPHQLERLMGQIANHASSGAAVMIETLGLFSTEWPRLWSTAPGAERVLTYAMTREVEVHPWAPDELARLAERAGLQPLGTHDRTIQASPKATEYWPGLPDVRGALHAMLAHDVRPAALTAALPPLPAGPAAAFHQELAARRAHLVDSHRGPALARSIWDLERGSGGGFGHGLVLVARVP